MSNSGNYDQFRSTVYDWLPLLTHVHVSYLAIKTQDAKALLLLRVILHANLFPLPYKPFKHESDRLICRTVSMPLRTGWLQSVIDGASVGAITIGRNLLWFALTPPQQVNYHFNKASAMQVDEYRMRVPGLDIYGSDLRDVTREIDHSTLDWEIRSGRPAFQGHRQLLERLGFRSDLLSVSQPTVEIVVLPPGVIRSGSKMSKGKATVRAKLSGKCGPRDFSLTYAPKDGGPAKDELLGATSAEWIKEKTGARKQWVLETGDHSEVDVYLNFKNKAIHHVELRDDSRFANPYLLAFECYDKDSKVMRQLIDEARKDTIGFEIGVSLLLSSLGLSVSTHGAIRKIQHGPDVLAFVPTKKAIVVVECTSGILSANDKLSKLHDRTIALRKQLSNSTYSDYEVHPLIVSALPRERLTVDLPTARGHGISVAAKEELDAWLERRKAYPDPNAVYKTIVGLVPMGGDLSSILSGEGSY